MADSKMISTLKANKITICIILVCIIAAGIFGGLKYKQYKLVKNIEQNYKTFNEITYLNNGNDWGDDPLAKTCLDTIGFQIYGYSTMIDALDKISDIGEIDKTIDKYVQCTYKFDSPNILKLNDQDKIVDNFNTQIASIKDLDAKEKAEKLFLLLKEIKNKNHEISGADIESRRKIAAYLTLGIKRYYHKEISLSEKNTSISEMDSLYKDSSDKIKKLKVV